MSDKADIDDVKAYVKALAEEALSDERDVGSGNLYLCACILAASDRIANATYDASEEIHSMKTLIVD